MTANPMALTARSCPMCASAKASPRYTVDTFCVVACDDCDFTYLPVAAGFEHYTQGEGAWENAQPSFIQERLAQSPIQTRLSLATRFRTKIKKKSPVQYIDRHTRQGQGQLNVLDIGCGAGGYLLSLKPRYVPFGIDISRELAAMANASFSSRGGFVVTAPATSALSQFEPGSMDAIVMRSYLEHEAEPLEVLKGCFGLVKKDGLVVVKVPNYAALNRVVMGSGWCGFRFPDHVNFFTPKSLTQMAAKAGFRTQQRFVDKLPTSDNMWAVLTPIH
jgi:2-polyprenyl-3-methyl-5-hydroxy-6-metoxy-1,4-benzoquinol methylase